MPGGGGGRELGEGGHGGGGPGRCGGADPLTPRTARESFSGAQPPRCHQSGTPYMSSPTSPPEPGSSRQDETRILLSRLRRGEDAAFDELFEHVYEELREIAHFRLSRHRPGETLNTTALVHEAYMRLVGRTSADWQDRAHFLAVASRAMRFIIIDYARARSAAKRGGKREAVPLDELQLGTEARAAADLLTLDDSLDKLAGFSERLADLVEYRFFGGLTYKEISEVTGRSVPTVKRDWRRARTWLYRSMQPAEG